MSLFMDLLVLSTAWTHVLLTPFTKVEESFNLHATHDVLMYGLSASNLPKYDHFVFPGAVPRSFLGSILLAWCSRPVVYLLKSFDAVSSKADLLIIVRLVLATLNAIGLCTLRRAVSKRFGFSTGAFFTFLTCSQFHLPFWMGRTLPNMFALLPVNIAYSYVISRMPNSKRPAPENVTKAISLLTFTATVFRAEIAGLLGPLVLQALLARWISFRAAVRSTLIAALASITLTTLLDSYFWQQWPLWPELYSLYFNVYQNKSVEWGVSPFHAYFSTHLPKLLLSSAPLAALGLLVEPRVRSLLVSPIVFIGLLSCLGHKEWRFIVYVVPLFNIAAARGAYWMSRQPIRTIIGRLCLLILLGCVATNAIVTNTLVKVSMANYPGGLALVRFNELFTDTPNVHVHIDNLAAQTGASLFLHIHSPPPFPSPFPSPSSSSSSLTTFPWFFRHVHSPSTSTYLSFLFPPSLSSHFTPPSHHKSHKYQPPEQLNWTYNKTENLLPSEITSTPHFTHLITESPNHFSSSSWKTVECVKAFDGYRFTKGEGEGEGGEGGGGLGTLREKIPMFSITYSDKLCILSRRQAS